MFKPAIQPFRRFLPSQAGNVTMMFALGAPLLCLAIAIAVDFNNASVARSKLNAAADAAALAALTPAMMQQPVGTAQSPGPATLAAQAMWNARVSGLGSLINGTPTMTPNISDATGKRVATISYSANVNTIFAGLLSTSTLAVSGASTATAALPPNTDFYLLLDNSPSMSLPSTSDGIAKMISLTPTQDSSHGCAFACHQAATTNTSNPLYHSTDTMGNLCTDGTTPPFPMCTTSGGAGKGSIAINPANKQQLLKQFCSPDPYCTSTINQAYASYSSKAQMDNYALALNAGITLRLAELTAGVTQLTQQAYNYQTSGLWSTPPVYRFAAYSIDSAWQIGTTNTPVMGLTTNYTSGWTSASSSFGVMEMFSNNNVCANSSCSASGGGDDVATNFSNALGDINAKMPNPGNGTNLSGDTPQEVLFIVTDGVEDQTASSCTWPFSGTRCQAPLNPALCATIKNRGIKIAVLYTEYLAVPTNSWYLSWIAPFQSTIESQLQACASSSSLYYKASLGNGSGSIANGLTTLFQNVQSPTLSN